MAIPFLVLIWVQCALIRLFLLVYSFHFKCIIINTIVFFYFSRARFVPTRKQKSVSSSTFVCFYYCYSMNRYLT